MSFDNFDKTPLYVIAVISNPARYKTRYRLYREFEAYMNANPKVKLYTVEMAYGDRPFEVTSASNPRHIQVRSKDELWHKENLINIGVSALPQDWKYMAWIDADTKFARYDWAEETIHQLQHYPIVQLFSHSLFLDAQYAPQHGAPSLAYGYRNSRESFDPNRPVIAMAFKEYGETPYKTGLGWAYTREAYENIGGMMDRCIIGSADYHMAAAFIGDAEKTIPSESSDAYKTMILRWQDNAYAYIQGRIGYVDGLILHFWHGEMKDRRYRERWKIVNNFDPDLHIVRDWSNRGLLKFSKTGELTDVPRYLSEYFRLRNEDAL